METLIKGNNLFKSPKFTDYSKPKANSLQSLPIAELAETCTFSDYEVHVEAFIQQHGLKLKTWFYPQALAHVAKWRISRGASGLFSGKALVVDNCKNDPFNRGLYWILMSKHRAVQKQYTQTEYCSLVPLIPSAFKKLADIKYCDWDTSELHFVVGPDLLKAMTTTPPQYTREELLEFRVKGLITGDTAKRSPGANKNPATTYNLYSLPKEMPDGRVGPAELPPLVRMMLCQTWCCHPTNRNPYMILDPLSWDHVPEPLIETDVIAAKEVSDLEEIWR